MASCTKKITLLAAGYLLGKSKGMKSVLLVAGGVAYGRLMSQRSNDDESSGALVSKFSNSPELQRVTSGLAEAARGAFSATASKGLETLNENLQNRTAALREEGGSEEQPAESEDATESDEAESQETEESEDSEQVAEDEATESGGR